MLPNRFKEIRKFLGWTATQCADELICGVRTVRRYEQPPEQKGHRNVPWRVAEKMQKWYDDRKKEHEDA